MTHLKQFYIGTVSALAVILLCTPAHAQISDRMKSSKPIISAPMKATPCVNPNEPCGGEIFKLDVQKLNAMKLRDRDLKKYIMVKMKEQVPGASPAMLEGGSGLIIALLNAREVRDAENIELEMAQWPPKVTVTVSIKIKFGK